MSVLQREQRDVARRSAQLRHELYRRELQEAGERRRRHVAGAAEETARIERLFQGAEEAGLSVLEIARLTGVSRPTLYRMRSNAQTDFKTAQLRDELQHSLSEASEELGRPAVLFDLAERMGLVEADLRDDLDLVFPKLAAELEALGSSGLTGLVDLLPNVPKNEKIVLNLLFLQRLSLSDVAGSVGASEAEVIVWTALALLRVLPPLHARLAEHAGQ
jgi:AraC-like DNA-binding protein